MIALFLIGLRIIWQLSPSLLTCFLFWSAALFIQYKTWNSTLSDVLCFLGIASNAIVCLFNNGFMPVLGLDPKYSLSVWRAAQFTPGRLLWMCDKYAGFSIGDMLIGAGLLVLILHKVFHWKLLWLG